MEALEELKLNGDGDVRQYKARLMAKDISQRPGIDFEETFSPVVKHDSLRVVLALTAELDIKMLQLDVKTAFPNGDLHEDLYMVQPMGFIQPGREDTVCKLNRSLYRAQAGVKIMEHEVSQCLRWFWLL